jgi:hypothetical protein
LRKLVGALLETRGIVEKNEIEPRELVRERLVLDLPEDDGRQTLVERGRKRDLLQRNRVGPHRVGTEHEHNRIRSPDQVLDALPPLLEGVDVGAVDERFEAARLQGSLDLVREGEVLARIGDEDFCLRLLAAFLFSRIGGHGVSPVVLGRVRIADRQSLSCARIWDTIWPKPGSRSHEENLIKLTSPNGVDGGAGAAPSA